MAMSDDRDFETLLRRASTPVPPPDALARLVAKAGPKPGAAIIPFRRSVRAPLWPAAALLAASLAAGVYLGAAGFTDALYIDSASLEEPVDLVGAGELAGDAT